MSSKFSQYALLTQVLLCAVLLYAGSLFVDLLFGLPYTSPWKYLLLAFLMPVYSLVFMPLLTLLRVANYKSELLFVTKDAKNNYAIHFGALSDCILSGLFHGKRGGFGSLMLYFLVDGLLSIINDIESGAISEEATIMGTSYFFSERSAQKFGFEVRPLQTSHKYILYANYLEILLVYSFTKGRLSFPDFSKFKSVSATGKRLVENKAYVVKLHQHLKDRVKI